jgi:dTMP kinase
MGLFLTFEGPDGSGKSTQAHLLASELRARGHDVVETREPGGTGVGEAVRRVLLDLNGPAMSPLTMALLLSASRAQLVSDVIVPALDGGHTVIADRYADSTVAYQAYGFGLDLDVVRELARIATGGLTPQLTVFVDVPVELGLERIYRRGSHNRLDAPDMAFHNRVRNGYLQSISLERGRWVVVDGTQDPSTVHREVMRKLAPLLEEVAQPT